MVSQKNPFTTKFGGEPRSFFGRSEQLAGFSEALYESGSDYRTTFITGSRGFGKTSLIEQFSIRAREQGWMIIDTQSTHALHSFYRHLTEYDQIETGKNLNPTVSTPLGGGSLGQIDRRTLRTIDIADIDDLFIAYCSQHPEGVCVTIDEVQKTPIEELSTICGAFQMASRKGHNVILSIAGLPPCYEKIIQHEGCTYLRRANHIELDLFSHEEVSSSLRAVFKSIHGLTVDDEALALLTDFSKGQPYMLQLLGYYSLNDLGIFQGEKNCALDIAMVDAAFPKAIDAYESRMLSPMVNELGKAEREFISAMAQLMQGTTEARIGEIASHIGKTTSQLSPVRSRLIKSGIISAIGYGKVCFAIPYLRDYLRKQEPGNRKLRRLREWSV